tara:strand:- start:5002 stop:5670 length:669 start_codon:yes stop_codon:yes gene_type:complete
MSWLAIAAIGSFLSYRQAKKDASRGRRMTQEQFEANMKFRDEQQRLLDIEKDRYREQVFVNPYEGLENPFDDLTVNQQEADFAARRAEQTRANILDSLRQAAGASGISGLAQTLANQGALQTQRISAQIGKQETANRLAAAKGQLSVELAERKGEAMLQNMEASRQATILGMQQSILGAAQAGLAQADANRLSAQLYGSQMVQNALQSGMKNTMYGAEIDKM